MPPAWVKEWNEGRYDWGGVKNGSISGTVKIIHQERPIQRPGLQGEGLLLPVTYWLKTE